MSEHSLQQLLARMKDKPITLGWGAIAAFSRKRLNDMLRHQYVAGLNDFRLMRPFSAEIALTDEENMYATFTDVIFGAPQLSFASSSLPGSSADLALSIIGGSFSLVSRHSTGPARLVSCFDFSEEEGFNLSMKLDMATLLGEVDQRGRFALDLEKGEEPRCNAQPEWPAQQRMGAALFNYIKQQPRNVRVFSMGLMDFNGYDPLSPRAFYLYTQAAPGATDGDGALLLFTRVKALDENGREPVAGSDFPYLIPSDKQNGEPLYTASLVINADLRKWVEDRPPEVARSLTFPARNLFAEANAGRHEPHDMLLLGNISPARQSASLEPLQCSVKAGAQQQFQVRHADGRLVQGVRWSTHSLGSPLAGGSISADGLYTAPPINRMGKDSQQSLVVASYQLDGVTYEDTAVILDRFEGMDVLPRARSVMPAGEPVDIRVGSPGGGELQWRLLEPGLGSLEVVGEGHAVYTPPATVEPLVSLQKIECLNLRTGETIESAMIIVRATPGGIVEPPFVPSIAKGAGVQFETNIPPDRARWSVIGEGSIDQNGLFTPPAEVTSLISLVLCDFLLDNDTSLATGFATVQLSKREEEQSWVELDEFSIKPSGGVTQCFANGYQQIPLIITVTTKAVLVDGKEVFYPLDAGELASIRVVDSETHQDLPVLEDEQEGIDYGSGDSYAILEHANRFNLYSANGVEPMPAEAGVAPRNESERQRRLFLHTTQQGSRKFYARFRDKNGGSWTSLEWNGEGHDIELTGIKPPAPDPNPGPNRNYDIVRARVWNGPGEDDGDDDFTYRLESVDYWTVSYQRLMGIQVPFATLRIERNCSTIQWESEQIEELFFSYTGHAFYPAVYQDGITNPPARLTFDIYFRLLHELVGASPIRMEFEPNQQPSPGELMVSLHRVADMPYWYDGMAEGDEEKHFRALLDPPMVFVMLDMEGNRHRLMIGFQPPTLDFSRNTLVLNVQ